LIKYFSSFDVTLTVDE